MKDMSSREILDSIRRGVEESADRFAEHKPQHESQSPLRAESTRSIGQMTGREILQAIDRGLEETSLRFVRDDVRHEDAPQKAEGQLPSGRD